MLNLILGSKPALKLLKALQVHTWIDRWLRTHPRVREEAGLRIRIDSLEAWLVEREIFQEKEYEGVFDLSGVQTFCDAGCNRGLFTAWLASRCKNREALAGLLIEANAHLLPAVERLLQENALRGCQLVHGALGAGVAGDTVELLIPPNDVGAGLGQVVAETLADDRCERVTVPALGLGERWDRQFGGARCQLLKVDIEGAELRLFQDERAFLKRVDQVIVEVHERVVDLRAIEGLLTEAGMIVRGKKQASGGGTLLFASIPA